MGRLLAELQGAVLVLILALNAPVAGLHAALQPAGAPVICGNAAVAPGDATPDATAYCCPDCVATVLPAMPGAGVAVASPPRPLPIHRAPVPPAPAGRSAAPGGIRAPPWSSDLRSDRLNFRPRRRPCLGPVGSGGDSLRTTFPCRPRERRT